MNQKELAPKLEELHADSFAWALRCCFEDRASAKEVMQNTYLKILDGKAKYKAGAAFKTWLFSVIRFTAIDYYRANRRCETVLLDPNHAPTENMVTEMDENTGNAQKQAVLQKALSELSPQQNRVLHLVFYQNCSIAEAAEIMNIQLGTARSHYERGKRQLKRRLIALSFKR